MVPLKGIWINPLFRPCEELPNNDQKENCKLTTLATLAVVCHSNSVLSVLTIGNIQTTLIAISFTVSATNWIKAGWTNY